LRFPSIKLSIRNRREVYITKNWKGNDSGLI